MLSPPLSLSLPHPLWVGVCVCVCIRDATTQRQLNHKLINSPLWSACRLWLSPLSADRMCRSCRSCRCCRSAACGYFRRGKKLLRLPLCLPLWPHILLHVHTQRSITWVLLCVAEVSVRHAAQIQRQQAAPVFLQLQQWFWETEWDGLHTQTTQNEYGNKARRSWFYLEPTDSHSQYSQFSKKEKKNEELLFPGLWETWLIKWTAVIALCQWRDTQLR